MHDIFHILDIASIIVNYCDTNEKIILRNICESTIGFEEHYQMIFNSISFSDYLFENNEPFYNTIQEYNDSHKIIVFGDLVTSFKNILHLGYDESTDIDLSTKSTFAVAIKGNDIISLNGSILDNDKLISYSNIYMSIQDDNTPIDCTIHNITIIPFLSYCYPSSYPEYVDIGYTNPQGSDYNFDVIALSDRCPSIHGIKTFLYSRNNLNDEIILLSVDIESDMRYGLQFIAA